MDFLKSDDPFGYRIDLIEAIENREHGAVMLALARCIAAGVTVSDELREKTKSSMIDGLQILKKEMLGWIEAAENLGEDYDNADDLWSAAEHVQSILELRCDAAGLLQIYGEEIRPEVEKFDNALKANGDLLNVVNGMPWAENWIKSMEKIGENAWWLKV